MLVTAHSVTRMVTGTWSLKDNSGYRVRMFEVEERKAERGLETAQG